MNCKPGDLAVVVGSFGPHTEVYVGKLLRCIRLDPKTSARYGSNDWDYEPISQGLPDPALHTVDDAILRPIRDPGEGATDETLLWTPVPNKQEQPA